MDEDSRITADARLAFAAAFLLLAGACLSQIARAGPRARLSPEPYLVDVNAAPGGEIEALPGVGRVLAERIVEARDAAPFEAPDELGSVPGVGPATLGRFRPFVRCGGGR